MAEKQIFTPEELASLSAEEINNKIIYGDYSLLATLGGEELRKEMVPVGKICRAAVDFFINTTGPKSNPEKHTKNARKKFVRILSKVVPGSYEGFPEDSDHGLVVGFNHPSLGEIGRIMVMKMDVMGDKPMLFPVNLPWYEALAADFDNIKNLGVIITPTITPSTWKKLNIPEDSEYYAPAKKVKKEFRDLYTARSKDTVKNGGVIFVAPSATRQKTVFKTKKVYTKEEKIIPTMSVLALELYKDPDMNCDFLPMAVLPPEGYKKGLNLRKKYTLIPGEIMTSEYIRKTYFKTKTPDHLDNFDYDFHKRIADKLPKEFWY